MIRSNAMLLEQTQPPPKLTVAAGRRGDRLFVPLSRRASEANQLGSREAGRGNAHEWEMRLGGDGQ